MNHPNSISNPAILGSLFIFGFAGIIGLHSGFAEPAGFTREKDLGHLKATVQYDSLSQAITAARYGIRGIEGESEEAWAQNPKHGLNSRFDQDGLQLTVRTPEDQSFTLRWRLASFGCGDHGKPVPCGKLRHDGQRAEITRAELGLTEWFVNSPAGLEHGFTLLERPVDPVEPDELLTLTLAVTGDLEACPIRDGQALQLRDPETGATVLTYDTLKVWDADRCPLTARMRKESGLIVFEVEDENARYPLTIDPTFAQQAYLKASNTGGGDLFGSSVAVSGDALVDTVVVGARAEASNATGIDGDENNDSAAGSGAAYVFVRTGSSWTQQAYLKASNTGASDEFGSAVAVDDDTIVVGAANEDSNATVVNGDENNDSASNSGAAYVFVRDGMGTWTQQAYLKASNSGSNDTFGGSVSVSGDTIVVGADSEDTASANSGAAYVFTRSGTTWSQQDFLTASNGGFSDSFGRSVAVSDDTIAVGAPNEDSNATAVNGNGADNSAPMAGAAYIFTRSGTIWSQQAYLKASNSDAGDRFGGSVAVSDDTVVAGAETEQSNATGVNGNETDNSADSAGAAYVFVRSGTDWTQQAYLKASITNEGDAFGRSVVVDFDTIVVGAYLKSINTANSVGAAFAFARSGTAWSQQAFLKASNSGAGDTFGGSVAVSGETVVVGATGESSNATGVNGNQAANSAGGAGAAYVFIASAVDNSAGIRKLKRKIKRVKRQIKRVNKAGNRPKVRKLNRKLRRLKAQLRRLLATGQ